MTKRDVLKRYARDWRNLVAWGAPLPMTIEIKDDPGYRYAGRAKPHLCSAVVFDSGDLAWDLETILHEMAHLAAPNQTHHGAPWREIFARGAAEALGVRVSTFDVDVDLRTLSMQVSDAIKEWLDRTGQRIVLTAIGVLP